MSIPEIDLERYMKAEDESARYEEAFNERVEKLIAKNGECDPYNAHNINTVFPVIDIETCGLLSREFNVNRAHTLLEEIIAETLNTYMHRVAEATAEKQLKEESDEAKLSRFESMQEMMKNEYEN